MYPRHSMQGIRRMKYVFIGATTVILVQAFYLYYYSRFAYVWFGTRPENDLGTSTARLKTILFWNEYVKSRDFHFGVGHSPFQRARCPVDTCYAHHNRSLLDPQSVDVILIHGRSEYDYEEMENRFRPDLSYARHPLTKYIYFLHEAPFHQYQDLKEFDGFYNYTMTYRLDSDIPVPYGQFIERKDKFSVTENFAGGKKKFAAWFVSNCRDHSGRQEVAKNLQQYIDVDIYGNCGPLKCSEEDWECYEMLNDYRFYFSFENSLCKDYVTEKLFGVMNYTVIPVVLSGADVPSMVPPHSVINIVDFESPRHLADYLIYLSKNDTAYNEYFQWRGQYQQRLNRTWDWTGDWNFAEGFCDLCAWLHREVAPKAMDIHAWYTQDQCVGADHPMYSNFTQSRRIEGA